MVSTRQLPASVRLELFLSQEIFPRLREKDLHKISHKGPDYKSVDLYNVHMRMCTLVLTYMYFL